MAAPTFPPALGNGPLVELILGEAWAVEGWFDMTPIAWITRTMTVLRSDRELCLFNSVRLDAETEQALAALGTVRHVVKVNSMHSRDDAYYVAQFGAEYWVRRRDFERCMSSVHRCTCSRSAAAGAP
jgi:hypothetical protein